MRRNKVRLYIPSKDRRGKRVSNRKVVAEAEELFVHCFGGCTLLEARGVYLEEGGKFIRERIKIIESSCTDDELGEHLPTVRAFAERVKVELNQEAVALEVNNVLEFI
jgi:hypothetical protein